MGTFLLINYRNRRPDYLKAFLDHLVNGTSSPKVPSGYKLAAVIAMRASQRI
jgi:hypothetical protein